MPTVRVSDTQAPPDHANPPRRPSLHAHLSKSDVPTIRISARTIISFDAPGVPAVRVNSVLISLDAASAQSSAPAYLQSVFHLSELNGQDAVVPVVRVSAYLRSSFRRTYGPGSVVPLVRVSAYLWFEFLCDLDSFSRGCFMAGVSTVCISAESHAFWRIYGPSLGLCDGVPTVRVMAGRDASHRRSAPWFKRRDRARLDLHPDPKRLGNSDSRALFLPSSEKGVGGAQPPAVRRRASAFFRVGEGKGHRREGIPGIAAPA